MVYALAVLFSVLPFLALSSHPCPNACSGHGRCNSPDRQCTCFDGYTGADCSLRICPFDKAWADQATETDVAHNPAECSNMGLCDRATGLCICREGFEGIACERQTCPNQCNGVGECQSMFYFAQTKDPGFGVIHAYENIWDAYKIYGCNCDSNYHGIDCSLRYCPKGDDPLTGTTQISDRNPKQYNEIQRISCKADGGHFTLTFRGKTTVPIPYNAKAVDLQSKLEALPTIGKGNIKLVMYSPQACTDYGASWTIEFLQNFGSLPKFVPDKRKLLFSNSLSQSTLTVEKDIDGTKENIECSRRGICDTTSGICDCSFNFDTSNGYNSPGTRGDCGYATDLIQFCPGVVACSAHGECQNNPTYHCKCSDGWTGADCSERLCPTGLSWFLLPESDNVAHITSYSECSNAGLCDRTSGQCQCQLGFSGSACERLTCPGASSDTEGCSGHGKCLDMATLASLATVNGDLGGFTYGSTPNNPHTWDGSRIFGCLCDAEYMGYDCSLYVCPSGDDPLTSGQRDEVQHLSCVDSDLEGSIVLTFRQKTSVPLSPTATIAEVQNALEGLDSVGEVRVEILNATGNNSLCTPWGNTFVVTFLTEHGDLPDIQGEQTNIDTFQISEYAPGTKETLVCAGRGLCNHDTGMCECFDGFGSSDGKGNAGTKRDCGYQEPITKEH